MLWLDRFGADPVTGFLWRAATGTESAYDLAKRKAQTEVDIKRAAGPGASPEYVKNIVDQSLREQEGVLREAGAHPEQAFVGGPGLQSVGRWVVLVFAGAALVWVTKEVLVALVSRRK